MKLKLLINAIATTVVKVSIGTGGLSSFTCDANIASERATILQIPMAVARLSAGKMLSSL